MALHTIRVESTAEANQLELRSAATWVRGPGRAISFHTASAGADDARLEIDDRVLRFSRTGEGLGPMSLVLQVATTDDRLALLATKSAGGVLTLESDADRLVHDGAGEPAGAAHLVLFLAR